MEIDTFTLNPFDNKRLLKLCGHLDENLQQLDQRLKVSIRNRGNIFEIQGEDHAVSQAKAILKALYKKAAYADITPTDIHSLIQKAEQKILDKSPVTAKSLLDIEKQHESFSIPIRRSNIYPRNDRQKEYVQSLLQNDINFAIGPAGTGKTFLAVACAVSALEQQRVQRIILVRPVVEAGEKLGFLPGDLAQKVDPYLRPLYDALYDTMGIDVVTKLLERKVIELAPLAYMRGRTLENAFIILDEGQNTTVGQMKMFLTRLGLGSTAVITGDVTQVDLPKGVLSGLRHAQNILKGVKNISVTHFTSEHVVRHPLVQDIIDAYDANERTNVYDNKLESKNVSRERTGEY